MDYQTYLRKCDEVDFDGDTSLDTVRASLRAAGADFTEYDGETELFPYCGWPKRRVFYVDDHDLYLVVITEPGRTCRDCIPLLGRGYTHRRKKGRDQTILIHPWREALAQILYDLRA